MNPYVGRQQSEWSELNSNNCLIWKIFAAIPIAWITVSFRTSKVADLSNLQTITRTEEKV
jgi:hypothetical protein